MYLYLDLETIPTQREDAKRRVMENVKAPKNYKDEAKIAEYKKEHADDAWRQTALSGDYGEIVVACYAIGDGELRTYVRDTIDEPTLLETLYAAIKHDCGRQYPTIVGHNLAFDLRFLHHRSIVFGVRPPFHLPYNTAPWQSAYVDTMYEWCGAKGSIKLTELCNVLDVDVGHDDTIDGSMVWDTWNSGDHDTVMSHCIADVKRVREVHKRLTFTV